MWFRSAKFVILLSNFFVWLFPLHTPAYKKPSPLLLHLNKLRVIVTNIVTFNHTCGQMTSSTLLLCSIALLYSASFGAEAWTSPYMLVSPSMMAKYKAIWWLHMHMVVSPSMLAKYSMWLILLTVLAKSQAVSQTLVLKYVFRHSLGETLTKVFQKMFQNRPILEISF